MTPSSKRRAAFVLATGLAVFGCHGTGSLTADGSVGGAGGSADAEDPEVVLPNCAVDLSGYGGRHCAAYQDGSVWCWGAGVAEDPANFAPSALPAKVEGLTAAKRVVVGPGDSCAAGSAGIFCWGNNGHAQIDDSGVSPLPPTGLGIFPDGIAAPTTGVGVGAEETCVVNAVAHVYCRGTDAAGVVHPPRQIGALGESPDTRIPGPLPFVVEDGKVFAVDDWDNPRVIPFFGSDNVVVVSGAPSCAVKRDGTLWCGSYSSVDGGVLTAKSDLGGHALGAGSGDAFVCALTDDYRVWCDGLDLTGQLGRPDSSPGGQLLAGDYVQGLSDVRVLSVNRSSACALSGDGKVSCWGIFAAGRGADTPQVVSTCVNQRLVPTTGLRSFGG